MRRHRTYAATTLAAALLLTTACASDDDSETGTGDDIAGVDDAGQDTTDDSDQDDGSDSETPDDDTTDRPEIELPDDMNNVFEDTETGDPTKDEIINDVIQGIESVDFGVAQGDPRHEAVQFYYTLDALDVIENYIDSAVNSGDEGRSWRGSVTHYDFEVANDGHLASEPVVSYCSDRSDVEIVDMESGEALQGDQYAGDQKSNSAVVERNDDGVWQHRTILPDDAEADLQCAR